MQQQFKYIETTFFKQFFLSKNLNCLHIIPNHRVNQKKTLALTEGDQVYILYSFKHFFLLTH